MWAPRLRAVLQDPGRRANLMAVTALVVVPVLIYLLPGLLGNPQLPGDDALQNYPLRVLAGREIASGHLPLFNAYLWSGAPLLGGWNAGALYPFTLLFAVLPPTGAWVANELLVYWVVALGLYWFLRRQRLRPLAAVLGAASFSFAGAMELHLGHFGLVAGTSWLPLMLVAVHGLAAPGARRSRAGYIVLLAAGGGLCVLAGEPRAIDTTAIVVLLYALWALARGPRRGQLLAGLAVAGVIAALIGAAQWLPGALEVGHSQRSTHPYELYASGSLPVRWLLLGLVPSVLGGSGSFGTSSWYTGYNLPEVVGYVGILPVAAAVGLLGAVRRGRRMPDWLVWHVVAVVGIVLALGGFTPLGRLFVHIPFFGGQRLQSRNIEITDLALAVLLAYWLELLLARRDARPGSAAAGELPRDEPSGDAPATVRRVARWSYVALACTGVLTVVALAIPSPLAGFLGAGPVQAPLALAQRRLYAVFAVLLVAAVVLVTRAGGGRRRQVAWLAGGLVVADLLAFNLTCVWSVLQGTATSAYPDYPAGTAPAPMAQVPDLGRQGRFAMYDPAGVVAGQLWAVDSPDRNVLHHRFTMQGYTAIVDGTYAQVTGSHGLLGLGLNRLTPATLDNGVVDQLDTTTLVTSSGYFAVPDRPQAPTRPQGPTATGRRAARAGSSATWVFGESLLPTAVSVPWRSSSAGGSLAARVGLEQLDGTTRWVPSGAVSQQRGRLTVMPPAGSAGVALVVAVDAGTGVFGPPVLTTAGTRVILHGDLEDAVGHWRFLGDVGTLAYFSNTQATAAVTLAALPGGTVAGSSFQELSPPLLAPASVRVDSPAGVAVVRSVAKIPGWTATWQPSGGARHTLAIRRRGLVQEVDVPAGAGVLAWHYGEPGAKAGVDLSVAGGAIALGLAGIWLARRRRGAAGVAAGVAAGAAVGDGPYDEMMTAPGMVAPPAREAARRPRSPQGEAWSRPEPSRSTPGPSPEVSPPATGS